MLASVFLLAACAPPKSLVESYPGEPVRDHITDHIVEQDEEAAEAEGEEDEGEDSHAEDGHAVVEGETFGTWLQQGGQLAVTTWGSSTCPVVGTDIRVIQPASEGNVVEIVTKQYPDDQVCTMDFVPYTSVFWTPMNIAPTQELTVQIAGEELTVPVK